MTSDNNDCVTIRARVRKSRRAIDPEFDLCRETIVSFVEQQQQACKAKGREQKCHSLLLTPVPTAVPVRARSLTRGNTAPVRRRQRSFGPSNNPHAAEQPYYARKASATSVSSLEMSGGENQQQQQQQNGANGTLPDSDGMVDVSLNSSINSNHSNHPLLSSNKPLGLPKHPNRYSSPMSVFRTSSGISAGGAGSVVSSTQSDTHLNNNLRSHSVSSRRSSASRSRSRSRSQRRGSGHLRMRSLGAANAFAEAAASGRDNADNDEADHHGRGNAGSTPAETPEPVSIPLGDVLSVDEEVPGRDGRAGGSDFYSSAASDVGAGTAGDENDATSPRPPPSKSGGNGSGGRSSSLHRIFLHTLSHGYVEFSLDHANSYDIFMAYLKAHLPPDRIPRRDGADRQCQVAGGATMLRTMVLTPTKEVPSGLNPSGPGFGGGNARAGPSATAPADVARAGPPAGSSQSRSTLPRLHLTRSSSTMGSTNIEKLQSKAMHQRLQNESTPMHRMKEQLACWMSNLLDCACCQDTTVAPVEEKSSIQATPDSRKSKQQAAGGAGNKLPQRPKRGRSQNTESLCGKGIGGLSFEEVSCGGTPKSSFERSVGGDSKSGKR